MANCLPPLVPSVKDEAPKLVSELLNTLLTTGTVLETDHVLALEEQSLIVNFGTYCLNLLFYFFLKDVIKSSVVYRLLGLRIRSINLHPGSGSGPIFQRLKEKSEKT